MAENQMEESTENLGDSAVFWHQYSPLLYHGAIEPSPPSPTPPSPTPPWTFAVKARNLFGNTSPIERFNLAALQPLQNRQVALQFKASEKERMLSEISKLKVEDAISHPSLMTRLTEQKGRGVFASEDIQTNTFLGTYPGELLTEEFGKLRERQYAIENEGCFLFYFDTTKTPAVENHLINHGLVVKRRYKIKLCLDPTKFDFSNPNVINGLINHSLKMPNIRREIVMSESGIPFVCFFAKSHISSGNELLFHYGDTGRHTPDWYRKS